MTARKGAPASTSPAIIERMRELLGEDAVRTDAESKEYFASDALGGGRGWHDETAAQPIAIVAPATTEELSAALRICHDERLPVTPYGAGSGLMGGARSLRPGVVLSTERLNRVREIDPASGYVWAEAGCVLADVDAAVRPHGLMIGHDPWTFAVATVGGAISTNGLGFLGGKYGSMGAQALAVEAVLADGTVFRTRPVQPHSTGIDLNHLVIAGEGQYAMIAAAALRAFPRPEAFDLRGHRFESFESGFDALLAMRAIGVSPAVLDYGDHPDSDDAAATLYLGFAGFREEVDARIHRSSQICLGGGARTIEQREVDVFWASRHDIADRFAERRARRERGVSPAGDDASFDYVHVALPPSRVLQYRAKAIIAAREHGVRVLETGLWTSPSLFSMTMMCAAGSREESVRRIESVVEQCVRLAHETHGSMEYCHGAGIRLGRFMRDEHGTGLDVMRRIKAALDPAGILNPGKLDDLRT